MANTNLRKADKVEFDEYYTQYAYIQKEVNAYLEYNPEQFKIIDGIGRYSVLNNEETKKAKKYLSMVNGEAKFFRIIVKIKGE